MEDNPDTNEQPIAASPADAARQIVATVGEYSLRYCAGRYPQLQWQAGVLRNEERYDGRPGLYYTVTLFWLKGHGSTQTEALNMAKRSEMEQKP